MQHIQQLIEKFWAGNASGEEREILYKQLTADKLALQAFLNKQYFDALQQKKSPLEDLNSKEILKKLHLQIVEQPLINKGKTIYLKRWTAWAAAAILIIAVGVGMYKSTDTHALKNTSNQQAVQNKKLNERQLIVHSNEGSTVKNITLADGSAVALQPKSSFSYYKPFDSLDRNISLAGIALFKVAKHKQHPFIVASAGFNTTAIGTQFLVNTSKENKVAIKLFEGRILVQSNQSSALKINDAYLEAGQEILIDLKKKQQIIQVFNNVAKGVNAPQNIDDKMEAVQVLSFNKEPLSAVFIKIKNNYKKQVHFNQPDVKGLSFTGSFNNTDSLTTVLSVICNMNNLSFTQTDEGITITKQQ